MTTGLHDTDEDFVYACYWVTRGDVFFNTTTCMTHIGTGYDQCGTYEDTIEEMPLREGFWFKYIPGDYK
tara:strand:- start:365 stop:571 length:207 start_codon:yes stop_codon:yes gene_type:complete